MENEKYAYFVDNTNKDIVYKMVCHYLNRLKHCDVKKQLNIYKNNVKQDSWIVYFESTGLLYDYLDFCDLDNAYVVENDYKVIKII